MSSGIQSNCSPAEHSPQNTGESGGVSPKKVSLQFGQNVKSPGGGKKINERSVIAILEKNLMQKFASEDFISYALKKTPEVLIDYMNSWSSETMDQFIDYYSGLVEGMIGKLFACGLDMTHVPMDIKTSSLFLRVAMNQNPKRLVSEILDKANSSDVRQAIMNFSQKEIKKLWDSGMSTNQIPSHKILEVFNLLIPDSQDSQRFSKEISRPINQLTLANLLASKSRTLDNRTVAVSGEKISQLS
jgi:hypothetical protein